MSTVVLWLYCRHVQSPYLASISSDEYCLQAVALECIVPPMEESTQAYLVKEVCWWNCGGDAEFEAQYFLFRPKVVQLLQNRPKGPLK